MPGGPADKYDMSVGALDKRIEAHDTILTVDGETATEDNILRLLRGDGKVIYQSWLRALSGEGGARGLDSGLSPPLA